MTNLTTKADLQRWILIKTKQFRGVLTGRVIAFQRSDATEQERAEVLAEAMVMQIKLEMLHDFGVLVDGLPDA